MALLLLLLALIVWTVDRLAGEDGDPAGRQGLVRLVAGERTVLRAPRERLEQLGRRGRRAWLWRLPATRKARRGRASVTLRLNRAALNRRVNRALAAGGGTVPLPEHPIASSMRLSLVRQALRNNCETAALSMLMSARGRRADQLALQAQLARSGPLDPKQSGGLPIWGDPDQGFVGRPDGGGTGGGYGVYQRPVRRLAGRHGVELRDLSGREPGTVYRSLLRGAPVMAWVGLSDGPYRTWQTPAGRRITGNFGEHTVVLTGINGDELAVNDPLSGRHQQWSRSQFEIMWRRLGRRALAL
jgi:uncharacterized protein YvpB